MNNNRKIKIVNARERKRRMKRKEEMKAITNHQNKREAGESTCC